MMLTRMTCALAGHCWPWSPDGAWGICARCGCVWDHFDFYGDAVREFFIPLVAAVSGILYAMYPSTPLLVFHLVWFAFWLKGGACDSIRL